MEFTELTFNEPNFQWNLPSFYSSWKENNEGIKIKQIISTEVTGAIVQINIYYWPASLGDFPVRFSMIAAQEKDSNLELLHLMRWEREE